MDMQIELFLSWQSDAINVIQSYNISISPPYSIFLTRNKTFQLYVLYNQEYNISIVTQNCLGISAPVVLLINISKYFNLVIH